MKFNCISLLCVLLLALLGLTCEIPSLLPRAVQLPAQSAAELPLPRHEPAPTDLRSVTLTEPARPWILPDKTWRAMADSRVNLDVSLQRGHEYIGIRLTLPFGS